MRENPQEVGIPSPRVLVCLALTHTLVDSYAQVVAPLWPRLDREFGVLCRPGLHCAPEVHRVLGTDGTGALRLSVGWCSTEADVDRALEGVSAIVASPAVRAS